MKKRYLSNHLLLLLFLLLFLQTASAQAQEEFLPFDEANSKISEVLKYIDNTYIDNINYKEAIENAIKGIFKELDPHSIYIPAEDYGSMRAPLRGNFEGIGIQFNIFRDTILIVSIVPDGPAQKQGLLPGDKIVSIDDKTVTGDSISEEEVKNTLKGPKAQKVKVAISRKGVDSLMQFIIPRDVVPLYSVDASYMAAPDIGYIRLNRFSASSKQEFKKALSKLESQGMQKLVLDLRGNGGGYLNVAVHIADQFLKEKQMIVYTKGRKFPMREYKASHRGDFKKGKLAILIDEGSASASEIVAGAIQDWDRGVIIGRRSFGKGLVQKPYSLDDGSVIRLTIAHYYTPLGRSIQKPFSGGHENYFKDIQERYKRGEMTNFDKIPLSDSLKYYTKKEKRVVYGGGGIVPDIFVPLDTASLTDYYRTLTNKNKNILRNFLLSYLENNRRKLAQIYDDVTVFNEQFEVTEGVLEDLVAYAEQEGLPKNETDLEISSELIKTKIKALLACYLWNLEAHYKVLNQTDNTFLKAVEILEKDSLFSDSMKIQVDK